MTNAMRTKVDEVDSEATIDDVLSEVELAKQEKERTTACKNQITDDKPSSSKKKRLSSKKIDDHVEKDKVLYRIQDFREGGIVWAKCSKRFPAWPAIVVDPTQEAHEAAWINANVPNTICVMFYGFKKNQKREYGWVKDGLIYPFLEYLESFLGQTKLNGRNPEDFRRAIQEAYKAENGYLNARSEDKEECFTTPKIVKLPVVSISDQIAESSHLGQKFQQRCGICKRILHYSDGAAYIFCNGCNNCVHRLCAREFTNVSKDIRRAQYYCPTCKGESIAGFEPRIQPSKKMGLPDLNQEFAYDGEHYYPIEPNNELGFGSQPACVDAPSASTYNRAPQSSNTQPASAYDLARHNSNKAVIAKGKEIQKELEFPLLRGSQRRINIARFSEYIPKVFHNYVSHIEDVMPDGNCGFRAVARELGYPEDKWPYIRDELLIEMDTKASMWQSVLNIIEHDFYDTLRHTLNWHGLSPAPQEHWMLTPETGLVIAERFSVIVHFLCTGGSLTFFPLTVDPESMPHHNIVSFCHTPNHFIVVEMEGDYPFPPFPSVWKDYQTRGAAKWVDMYASRLVKFDKLVNPKKYSGQPNLPVLLD